MTNSELKKRYKDLPWAWNEYRSNMLLTASEAYQCAKNRLDNPFTVYSNVFECIIGEVYEEIYCKQHDC